MDLTKLQVFPEMPCVVDMKSNLDESVAVQAPGICIHFQEDMIYLNQSLVNLRKRRMEQLRTEGQ